MKRVGIIIGVALAVLIVGALAVPLLIDWNRFKPMITTAASDALGRALTIDGDLEVTVAPTARITASQIHLANAPGMVGPRMATIERLEAEVRLLPLLGGRLVIDRLVVVKPEISLEIGADGTPNWRFERAAEPDPQPAQAAHDDLPVQEIALEAIEVSGGRLGFTDHRNGRTSELKALSLAGAARAHGASPAAMLASLSGQAELAFAELSLPTGPLRQLRAAKAVLELPPDRGDASLNVTATAVRAGGDGLPLVLALRTGSPAQLLAAGPGPFELRGELGDVKVDLAGSFAAGAAELPQELTLAVESASLAALAPLLGAELPDLRPATASATLRLGERRYRVIGLAAQLGASDLAGDLDIRLDGARPAISGKLASKRLDLVEARQASQGATVAESAPANRSSRVLSDAPLPLELLEAVDADLTILVGELRLNHDLALDDVRLPLLLKGGRLESAPVEAGLFGGRLRGRLAVDAAAAVPTVALTLDAQQIGVGGLLGRIALFEPRNATAQLALELRAAGRSLRELAAGADGHAELSAQGGVLNLGAARLLTIGVADILRPLLGGSSETELQCLLVRYRLQDGIANSDAQVLSTSAFAVLGAGKVDLRSERIDLRFATQSNSPSLMSFAVPFRISGTLGSPSAEPDVEGSLVSVFKVAGSIVDPIYALSVLAPGEGPRTGQNACVAALEQARSGIVDEATGIAAGVASGVVEGAGDVLEGVGGALGDLFGR